MLLNWYFVKFGLTVALSSGVVFCSSDGSPVLDPTEVRPNKELAGPWIAPSKPITPAKVESRLNFLYSYSHTTFHKLNPLVTNSRFLKRQSPSLKTGTAPLFPKLPCGVLPSLLGW